MKTGDLPHGTGSRFRNSQPTPLESAMKMGAFTEMDALALFMIELQAAKRKLLKVFDVSDGTFNERRAHRMSKGLESVVCLTHIKT